MLQTAHKLITHRFQRGDCAYKIQPPPPPPLPPAPAPSRSSLPPHALHSQRNFYLPLSEYKQRCGKKVISTVGEAFALQMRAIPGSYQSTLLHPLEPLSHTFQSILEDPSILLLY